MVIFSDVLEGKLGTMAGFLAFLRKEMEGRVRTITAEAAQITNHLEIDG